MSHKIFRPFFATIPIAIGTTGQGTGLGLSLAYDIVKAYGGELKVETKSARAVTEGETEARPDGLVGRRGTSFIIQLPAKEN